MSKTSYLLGRIIRIDVKGILKIAKNISKKTNKSRIYILKDMIYCGFKYQAGYYDYQEFELYKVDKSKRPTYLTRGKNNAIVKKYNDKSYFHVFENKAEFNQQFEPYIKRAWLNLKESSKEEFERFIKNNPVFIAKPIDGLGGVGIEKYTVQSDTSISKLYQTLKEKNQYLLEAFVIQHPEMNRLYDGSVNTLRMFTFYKDGQGHFLHAVLKIGNGGMIDNFSSGGMYTFLENDGSVKLPAVDKEDILYDTHPISQTKIIGFQVPMFDEAVELVKKAATVVPQIAYVGWDIAISKDGPVIIEGNCYPGIFQKRASFSPDGNGILVEYQKYMDI